MIARNTSVFADYSQTGFWNVSGFSMSSAFFVFCFLFPGQLMCIVSSSVELLNHGCILCFSPNQLVALGKFKLLSVYKGLYEKSLRALFSLKYVAKRLTFFKSPPEQSQLCVAFLFYLHFSFAYTLIIIWLF